MGSEPHTLTGIDELLEHAGWARLLARSLVADSATADDIVQETWLAALRHPPRHEGNLRGWISRIVRNLARRRHREEGNRDARQRLQENREPEPAPAELAAAVELQQLLGNLVLSLAEPYRTTVLLRYYQGLTSSEIGRRQGVAAGTVRWRLSQALDELRTRLDEDAGGQRGAWLLLLTRFASPDPTSLPTGGTFLGVTALTIQTKLALAAILLTGVFLATRSWWKAVEPESGGAAALVNGDEHEPAEIAVAPAADSAGRVPLGHAGEQQSASEEPAIEVMAATTRHRIRVLLPDGQRVAGCSVSVTSGGKTLELLTDSAGLCELELVEGVPWSLNVRDGDRARSGEITGRTSFFGALAKDPQDIVLYELVRVRGRVLLAGGSPAAGAGVSARMRGFVVGRGTPEGADCTASADGSFELLLEAREGPYEFRAEWRELEPHVEQLAIPSGESPAVILRFADPLEWGGSVVDPSGKPLVGARVHVLSAQPRTSGQPAFPRQTLATDSNGAFRSLIPPAVPFLLIAEHDDWSAADPLELAPRLLATTRPVLRLVESTEISGRVRWDDGRPAAGATLVGFLDHEDAEDGPDVLVRHSELIYGMARAETDADGRFRLFPVRPGNATYFIACLPDVEQRDRSVEVRRVDPGTADLEVILTEAELRGSVVRATVKYEDTGVPLEEFSATLYRLHADGKWWTEGSSRRFESKEGLMLIEGLTPGETYTAQIWPPAGYLPGVIDPWEAAAEEHVALVLLRIPLRIRFTLPASALNDAPLVLVKSVNPLPWKHNPAGRPDHTGRVELGLWPDRFVAYVRGPSGERLFETEFEVLPSSDGLVIQLGE